MKPTTVQNINLNEKLAQQPVFSTREMLLNDLTVYGNFHGTNDLDHKRQFYKSTQAI